MREVSMVLIALTLIGFSQASYAKSFTLQCPKVIESTHDNPETFYPLTVIPGSEYCFSGQKDIVEFKELSVDQNSFVCFYRTAKSDSCPVFEYRPKIKAGGRSVASTLDCPEVGLDRAKCEAHDLKQ